MGNLNKVMLIGRLGQDPEKRITPAGHSVVNVSVATTEFFRDQSGNKRERTEWHRVVFWNRQAEIVEQYCRKGSQIFVEGSLQTRDWQDKDGNKRYSTEVVARSLQLLDARGQSAQNQDMTPPVDFQPSVPTAAKRPDELPPQQGNQIKEPPRQDSNQGEYDDDFVEDDIPF